MTPTLLANRYILQSQLGGGGMGEVYRAHDRLSGETVALKRLPNIFADADDIETTHNFKLALTREFQTVASLRHPHIISVFDYGFDAEGQPFFTMELLSAARNLCEYATQASAEVKVRLIVQLLQAVHYLHRRGVIHRDLKPANVLVTADGRLRVLDFGLAQWRMASGIEWSQSGTLFYMAPEVLLKGEPPTIAVDLYAVGVIAYELFAGVVPFRGSGDVMQLFEDIMNAAPNTTLLSACPIIAVIERLLAKTPSERYGTALATLRAIEEFVPEATTAETRELRESFLQAAEFVGREKEFVQLSAALAQTQAGHGSSWLVGGESGVGKSRLLDELRIQALVQGFQVLRGQAIEGGGLPYQLWREPLRRLVLGTALSELEAGVLKPIVPDIATLLARDVSDAPRLDGAENVQRLVRVVLELLQRQTQPILLLLEDLQWAEESMTLLKEVVRPISERSVLVIGNYRNDERPQLPEQLPGAHLMLLTRLSTESIAQLSAAMLGEVGAEPQVVALLERESEGNTFFMVEVVRALAEESGQLENIGRMTLPAQVFAGGVQKLVQRRLAKVPADGQALLRLAAVGGRRLDMAVIARLAEPEQNLEAWLQAGAEAAVLEPIDGGWRFAHDKLREALLTHLDAEERRRLHRRVAIAIEQTHAEDPAYAEELAGRWLQAGDSAKVWQHALVAVRQILNTSRFSQALTLIQISLQLGESTPMPPLIQAQLLCDACECELELSNYAAALTQSEAAMALAQQIGAQEQAVRACMLHGLIELQQRDYVAAKPWLHQALAQARAIQHPKLMTECLGHLGFVASRLDQLAEARAYAEEGLALSTELQFPLGQTRALNVLGVCASMQNDFAMGQHYYAEALALHRASGNRRGAAVLLYNLGSNATRQRDYQQARVFHEEALTINGTIGSLQGVSFNLAALSQIALDQGDDMAVLGYLEQSLPMLRRLGLPAVLAEELAKRGQVCLKQGDYQQALAAYEESQALLRSLAVDGPVQERIGLNLCELYVVQQALGRKPIAVACLREGFSYARASSSVTLQVQALLAYAAWQFDQGEFEQAATLVGLLAEQPALGYARTRLLTLISSLESLLTPEACAVAYARGRANDLTQAVHEAYAKLMA